MRNFGSSTANCATDGLGAFCSKRVHQAMRPPETGGVRTDVTPTLYRRDTDREKPPR